MGYIVHVLVGQDKGFIAGWDTLYLYWWDGVYQDSQ